MREHLLMKKRVLFAAAWSVVLLAVRAEAQSLATKRQIKKANKQTIPAALKTIEETIGAKPSLEVDAASFGEDDNAWENTVDEA